MNKRVLLDYVEFYITNVCNFNCPGCNRFNNLVFTGQQRWRDYADIYQQWATAVDIKSLTVLGGEAMTNPDYLDWYQGLCKLWPQAEACLLTNGHYLKATNTALYEIIAQDPTHRHLSIGLHNVERTGEILDTVNQWLRGPVEVQRYPKDLREIPNFDHDWKHSYNQIRDVSWPDCDNIDQWADLPAHIKHECEHVHGFSPDIQRELLQEYLLTDSNGVRVKITNEIFFHQNALIPNTNGVSFRLHNSDADRAHDVCSMKRCHHFIKGALYKCGVVALLPEFEQQYHLDLSDSDRKLMNSYQPGTLDMSPEELKNFVSKLRNSIDQCKFCPQELYSEKISASHGNKIKFHRKKPTYVNKSQLV